MEFSGNPVQVSSNFEPPGVFGFVDDNPHVDIAIRRVIAFGLGAEQKHCFGWIFLFDGAIKPNQASIDYICFFSHTNKSRV